MSIIRTLIVDDEPLIRTGIRSGLASISGVGIVGECENGAQAVQAILSERPDLVLLDVRMPDCTGLDVVRQVGVERMPMVVFVTAYDEYAIKAFEINAVDYLLKPFDEERLRNSIDRARQRLAARSQAVLTQQLQALIAARDQKWPQRLVVKNGERYEFVAVDLIDWIESANNYVELHCGPKAYLFGETLSSLETRLDPDRFLRIHRCRIVNLSRIVAVHPMLNGAYQVQLRDGVRLGTGRQYRQAMQRLLQR
jgi:two-component system LytT family response regulator